MSEVIVTVPSSTRNRTSQALRRDLYCLSQMAEREKQRHAIVGIEMVFRLSTLCVLCPRRVLSGNIQLHAFASKS